MGQKSFPSKIVIPPPPFSLAMLETFRKTKKPSKFLVLETETFLKFNRDTPFVYNVFQYQKLSETPKGSLRFFSVQRDNKILNVFRMPPPMVYSIFSARQNGSADLSCFQLVFAALDGLLLRNANILEKELECDHQPVLQWQKVDFLRLHQKPNKTDSITWYGYIPTWLCNLKNFLKFLHL